MTPAYISNVHDARRWGCLRSVPFLSVYPPTALGRLCAQVMRWWRTLTARRRYLLCEARQSGQLLAYVVAPLAPASMRLWQGSIDDVRQGYEP